MYRLLIISTLFVLPFRAQSNESENTVKTHEIALTSTLNETTLNEPKSKIEVKSGSFGCADFDFNSVKEQADSLVSFMEKAIDSNSTDRQKWEHKFFCAFPNSFDEMDAVFGFDAKNGAAPLYFNPLGTNVIRYFSRLNSIPDSLYYHKYVMINIDGIWEADNIAYAFYFENRLLTDTRSACESLANFNDKEIISVFRFIFDNPHPNPKYNQKPYEELKAQIGVYNFRLSSLLTEAYETLMSEDRSH